MKKLTAPDAEELAIPGDVPDVVEDAQDIFDRPQERFVDKFLAVVVTFFPIIGFALAIYGHVAGWYSISWAEIAVMLMMHSIALVGVELGFHRLFAHNSYKPVRGLKIALGVMGSFSFQGPLIWWASIHRKHHRYSDRPNDPHSIYIKPDGREEYNKGFWQLFLGFIHAHVGWVWKPDSIRSAGWGGYVRDLYRDKDLWWIHVNYIYLLALSFILPGVILGLYYMSIKGFLLGVLWGGFVRVFVMNHLTYWTINTVSHSVGKRPFVTADNSTNSIPILFAIPTLGQSYHNNHHAFPYAAITGLHRYELDLGKWLLFAFKRLGWVKSMRIPSKDKLDAKRV